MTGSCVEEVFEPAGGVLPGGAEPPHPDWHPVPQSKQAAQLVS